MVLSIMQKADDLARAAGGSPAVMQDNFIKYFREGVVGAIRENPNILNSKGW